MHVPLVVALLATTAPSAAEPSPPSPPQMSDGAAPSDDSSWWGGATGAFLGSVAGALLCGGGSAAIEPSENAPFAMIAVCLPLVPTTLLGAAAGATLSQDDAGAAVLGAGLGMLGGMLAGGAIASLVIHNAPSDERTTSTLIGLSLLAGTVAGAPIGAAIATVP